MAYPPSTLQQSHPASLSVGNAKCAFVPLFRHFQSLVPPALSEVCSLDLLIWERQRRALFPFLSTTMDYDPSVLLSASGAEESASRSLIILNQPIPYFDRFALLWKHTSYRICADGGANQLYDLLSAQSDSRVEDYVSEYVTRSVIWTLMTYEKLPDLIHGDLDSLDDNVRKYYAARGVHVAKDSSQYRTDFAKAMLVLTKSYKTTDHPHLDVLGPTQRMQDIIIVSTMSGRMDQALGLLHEMYRETKQYTIGSNLPARLWFVGEQSVSFVLPIGKNTIRGLDPKKNIFTRNAGILPIYGEARISIKGFEWDVQDWETKMGGDVSTSNHVLEDEVEVEVTGEMVLFTIELADGNDLRS